MGRLQLGLTSIMIRLWRARHDWLTGVVIYGLLLWLVHRSTQLFSIWRMDEQILRIYGPDGGSIQLRFRCVLQSGFDCNGDMTRMILRYHDGVYISLHIECFLSFHFQNKCT